MTESINDYILKTVSFNTKPVAYRGEGDDWAVASPGIYIGGSGRPIKKKLLLENNYRCAIHINELVVGIKPNQGVGPGHP